MRLQRETIQNSDDESIYTWGLNEERLHSNTLLALRPHLFQYSGDVRAARLVVLRAAARYRGHLMMEALFDIYLGNRRVSLILIVQIVSPCDSPESRIRLKCVSDAYHNRNSAHSQQKPRRAGSHSRESRLQHRSLWACKIDLQIFLNARFPRENFG
jgi:hypothetical protein